MLNQAQARIKAEAVDWFRNSSEQVFEFEGPAGSGKTYLIYEILKELNIKLTEYLSMAYTGQASIVLRNRGFKTARSIHSSLYETAEIVDTNVSEMYGVPVKRTVFRKKPAIEPNIKLFFIDEGYMVPKYMKEDIESFGTKILVCGDRHQLPPVGDEPAYLTGSNVRHLDEIMRQAAGNPIIYIADRAKKGLPIHCGMYGNRVLVTTDDEFCPEMIGWADAIGCGLNRTKETLNQYVRQLAGFANSPTPVIGERIICKNNNWSITADGIALSNGLAGTVMSYPDATVYNGQCFMVDFKPDLTNNMFYGIPINYQYFTAPFEERQRLREFENRKYLQGEMFEFSYAQTIHSLQGSAVNNLIYIEEFMRPQIQNQLNYTGVTRAVNGLIYLKKKNKYIYIPDYKAIS